MQPVPLQQNGPKQKLAVDIITQLNEALPDYRLAITLINYFRKSSEIWFCSNATTVTVNRFLNKFFSYEGFRSEIVPDHESQFISQSLSSVITWAPLCQPLA